MERLRCVARLDETREVIDDRADDARMDVLDVGRVGRQLAELLRRERARRDIATAGLLDLLDTAGD